MIPRRECAQPWRVSWLLLGISLSKTRWFDGVRCNILTKSLSHTMSASPGLEYDASSQSVAVSVPSQLSNPCRVTEGRAVNS